MIGTSTSDICTHVSLKLINGVEVALIHYSTTSLRMITVSKKLKVLSWLVEQ